MLLYPFENGEPGGIRTPDPWLRRILPCLPISLYKDLIRYVYHKRL